MGRIPRCPCPVLSDGKKQTQREGLLCGGNQLVSPSHSQTCHRPGPSAPPPSAPPHPCPGSPAETLGRRTQEPGKTGTGQPLLVSRQVAGRSGRSSGRMAATPLLHSQAGMSGALPASSCPHTQHRLEATRQHRPQTDRQARYAPTTQPVTFCKGSQRGPAASGGRAPQEGQSALHNPQGGVGCRGDGLGGREGQVSACVCVWGGGQRGDKWAARGWAEGTSNLTGSSWLPQGAHKTFKKENQNS